jgi:hypothetical protein
MHDKYRTSTHKINQKQPAAATKKQLLIRIDVAKVNRNLQSGFYIWDGHDGWIRRVRSFELELVQGTTLAHTRCNPRSILRDPGILIGATKLLVNETRRRA